MVTRINRTDLCVAAGLVASGIVAYAAKYTTIGKLLGSAGALLAGASVVNNYFSQSNNQRTGGYQTLKIDLKKLENQIYESKRAGNDAFEGRKAGFQDSYNSLLTHMANLPPARIQAEDLQALHRIRILLTTAQDLPTEEQIRQLEIDLNAAVSANSLATNHANLAARFQIAEKRVTDRLDRGCSRSRVNFTNSQEALSLRNIFKTLFPEKIQAAIASGITKDPTQEVYQLIKDLRTGRQFTTEEYMAQYKVIMTKLGFHDHVDESGRPLARSHPEFFDHSIFFRLCRLFNITEIATNCASWISSHPLNHSNKKLIAVVATRQSHSYSNANLDLYRNSYEATWLYEDGRLHSLPYEGGRVFTLDEFANQEPRYYESTQDWQSKFRFHAIWSQDSNRSTSLPGILPPDPSGLASYIQILAKILPDTLPELQHQSYYLVMPV